MGVKMLNNYVYNLHLVCFLFYSISYYTMYAYTQQGISERPAKDNVKMFSYKYLNGTLIHFVFTK